MAWIKKMVMTGFKSFGKKTEVLFNQGITTIIGPNGSGKSNVSDALCFALGRLSIKSMRAAKAKNLIFMGSKYVKPSREANVSVVFDNSDKSFNINAKEVILERIVRINGQSIYKINNETKTRAEIIELLNHAGIDPYGYNIVLQGQIQGIVKMHPEERRKIIEEVAGISVYETRKEKSLHELEKTEDRLKEISAVLRERTAFLNNLEREKMQAERFKELELTLKRCKASIIDKKIKEKTKEIESVVKTIEEKTKEREKLREKANKIEKEIEDSQSKISRMNKEIQSATGVEQETLNEEITELRASLEGLRVRKESSEKRKEEIERRISEMEKSIPSLEEEIIELKKKAPAMAKKSDEIEKKKSELAIIEQQRKKLLSLKSTIDSFRERIKDKERQRGKLQGETDRIMKEIETLTEKMDYKNNEEAEKEIQKLRSLNEEAEKEIQKLKEEEFGNEKILSWAEKEIQRNEKIRKEVETIDICPLCQSKMTELHKNHVFKDTDQKISDSKDKISNSKRALSLIKEEIEKKTKESKSVNDKIKSTESELSKHGLVREKKDNLRKALEEIKEVDQEISNLESKREKAESDVSQLSLIEEKYHNKILEIEEISSRTDENLDTTLLFRKRDIEKTKSIIKTNREDLEELEEDISELDGGIENKEELLEKKEKQSEELNKRFKRIYEDIEKMQREMQEKNFELNQNHGGMRQIEEQANYLRVAKAKLDAEKTSLEIEYEDFKGHELIQAGFNVLEERLRKTQEALQNIGSINMRALEVYEQVKGEYEKVKEKADTLQKEKDEIMKIIEEIDKKKTRSFMKTFNSINEIFSENFAKLSNKGQAYLEIENNEGIFEGGVNIVVKMQRGKYFDVTSLSGGEQTLVALSLLFAIQEYRPYHFYILDEIDAALDKRNSERLAALLQQYMKSGQYIVVTHNDAIIMNSDYLYGVSMQDGVSKVLSLKVEDEPNSEKDSPTQ